MSKGTIGLITGFILGLGILFALFMFSLVRCPFAPLFCGAGGPFHFVGLSFLVTSSLVGWIWGKFGFLKALIVFVVLVIVLKFFII